MLTIHNLSFSYGNHPILKDFNLSLKDGEIVAIMGPSGCGKTTLLSLIAGLKKPSKGSIENTYQRICYVFQEPRLFPWLTVSENLRTVLESTEKVDEKIAFVLSAVGLSDCENRYPHELSGGMKSRVSLARAMLYGGDLFLLDEPFSALDRDLRNTLTSFLKDFLKQRGASAIVVTHQAEEAERFADRIVYLTSADSQ